MKRRRGAEEKKDQAPSRKKPKKQPSSAGNNNKLDNNLELQPYDISTVPAEIIRHILAQIEDDEHRRQLRLVSKNWFDWISFTNFTFGAIKSGEMELIADILSRYKKPIGLSILKGHRVQDEDLECLSRLTNLTSFALRGKTDLNSVPKNITKLTNLLSLEMDCWAFEELNSMTKLTKLKVDALATKLNLPNLEVLSSFLQHSTGEILAGFPKVTSFTCSKMSQAQYEMLVRNCTALKNLTISLEQTTLEAFRPINGLAFTSLESLETSTLFEAGCLKSDTLTRLIIREDVGAEAATMIPQLKNLKELEIERPDALAFQYFTGMSQLESLRLTGEFEDGHTFVDYMVNPSRLTELIVTLEAIPKNYIHVYTMFSNLESLELTTRLGQKKDFDCLAKLTKLRRLSIACDEGTSKTLQWTTVLTNLEHLHLAMPGGKSSTKLAKKFSVTNLTHLTYLFCRSVANQIDVRGLTNLEELGVSNITNQVDTPGLETLRGLKRLVMVHLMPNEQWQSFLKLTQLQSVYIECEGDNADEKFDSLTALKHLTSIMSMQSTWSGENLTRLTSLQSVTFGTKNPIGEHESVTEELREKLPLVNDCTYFEEFMSRFSILWEK